MNRKANLRNASLARRSPEISFQHDREKALKCADIFVRAIKRMLKEDPEKSGVMMPFRIHEVFLAVGRPGSYQHLVSIMGSWKIQMMEGLQANGFIRSLPKREGDSIEDQLFVVEKHADLALITHEFMNGSPSRLYQMMNKQPKANGSPIQLVESQTAVSSYRKPNSTWLPSLGEKLRGAAKLGMSGTPSPAPGVLLIEGDKVQPVSEEQIDTDFVPESETTIHDTVIRDENQSEENDSGSPTIAKLASEYPNLTTEEIDRIRAVERVLAVFSSGTSHKNDASLFLSGSKSWRLGILKKLQGASVVDKSGEHRFTKYIPNHDRIRALQQDPEWILRLFAPESLARIHSPDEEEEISSDLPTEPGVDQDVEDVLNARVTYSNPVNNSSQALSVETLEEIGRLLPQFFQILSYQHKRMCAMEKTVFAINAKFDALLGQLGVTPEDVSLPSQEEGADTK